MVTRKKKSSGLAVVEGKWSAQTNVSVKGLFDILSDINFDTPHAYLFEMFCDASSLDNIVGRMGKDSSVRYLYIGAHGTDDGIEGSGGKVSRTKLRNSLSKLASGSLEGLFLGTCSFGQDWNAEYLLSPPSIPNPPIKWVAGYTEYIDWIDSSVLDLLFWNTILDRRFARETPVERIRLAAEEILKLAPGLVEELGFCVYIRKKGPGGGILNLLQEY